MNRALMTHASYHVGSRLAEIAYDITRKRRYHGLLSLAMIDQQDQGL